MDNFYNKMNDNNIPNKQLSSDLSEQRRRYLELTEKIKSLQRINNILSCQVACILNQTIREVFIPKMKDMIKSKELSWIDYPSDYDWVLSSYAGFQIRVPSWKYFTIGIEFEKKWLKSPIIGFLKNSDYKREDIECWNELQNLYKSKDLNNLSWIYKDFKGSKDWHNHESVSQLIDGTMVNQFEEMIDEMLRSAEEVTKKGFTI